jgi:hypothetical protein
MTHEQRSQLTGVMRIDANLLNIKKKDRQSMHIDTFYFA